MLPTAHDNSVTKSLEKVKGRNPEGDADRNRTTYSVHIILALFVLALFFVAYRPTMFDFFSGDDLYNMVWAKQALSQPEMLFKKYVGPYPAETLMFYRPNLYAIFFLGFRLWGCNGLFFRLINVFFEILSSLMLAVIIVTLGKTTIEQNTSPVDKDVLLKWAIFSSILFLFYPSHCESVNWICVVTNPLVLLSSLIALWGYIKWRTESKSRYFYLSVLATIFAFLTKETAVALPLTIFTYEFLFIKGVRDARDSSQNETLMSITYNCLNKTKFHWAILFLYFGLRKVLLKDFVGGYPDSMCYQSFDGFSRGVKNMFIPINEVYTSSDSFVFKLWCIMILGLGILTTVKIIKSDKTMRTVVSFLGIWFLWMLLPNYKVFSAFISVEDNSRIVYLATAPLAALLAFGLTMSSKSTRFFPVISFCSLIVPLVSAKILYSNNMLWQESGRWTNNVIWQLKNYYRNVPGDPLVYIAAITPPNPRCIFALEPMNKKPIMTIDRYNCLQPQDERFISNGFIKEAIEDKSTPITLLYWNPVSEKLKGVAVREKNWAFGNVWQKDKLRQILKIASDAPGPSPTTHWLGDGTLQIISKQEKTVIVTMDLSLSTLSCWDADFIAINMLLEPFQKSSISLHKLRFTNNIVNQYSDVSPVCSARLVSLNGEQKVVFPLRTMPDWSMGGTCPSIKISIPIKGKLEIKDIEVIKTKSIIPSISFKVYYGDRPGQLRLGSNLGTQVIKYDCGSIKGANQAILQAVQVASVAAGNIDTNNVRKSFLFKKSIVGSSGEFALNKKDFPPEPGIYKAWLTVLNENREQVGYPSDDIFIRTDY